MKKPNSKKFNIIRIIKISCILLMFQNAANAELIFRGGYLTKMLPTSEGYNQFLKERYGASSIQLSGTTISTGFKSKARSWGIGFGMDDLSGNINYKTLNGDKKQNKMNVLEKFCKKCCIFLQQKEVIGFKIISKVSHPNYNSESLCRGSKLTWELSLIVF